MLSVAMCTYNGGAYLEAQLRSILEQQRQPDEVVVCDDGSSDSTLGILTAFARAAPFEVKVHVNATNLGSTRNFEKAITLCAGDLIALADQDDVWEPVKLARLESRLTGSPEVGAVFSDAEIVDSSLKPLGYRVWSAVRFGSREQVNCERTGLFPLLLHHNVVTGATMAFQARFRPLICPIPADWVHDAWIASIIAAHAPVAFVREPLLRYRRHPRQQIGARKPSKLRRLIGSVAAVAFRERGAETFGTAAARYAALVDRLANSGCPADALSLALAKVGHLQIRAHLPDTLLARAPIVASEMRSGRYRAFSSSWRSALRDLALRR